MAILINAGETTAARKRVYFHCVDATNGLDPETGEAGGQPQISTDGGAFGDAGIGVLVHLGNGRYYGELTDAAVASVALIEARYKSANTAEALGTTVQVVAFDPDDAVALGLSLMPANMTEVSGDSGAADNLERVTEVLAAAVSMMYMGSHGPGVWIDDGAANTATVVGTDGIPSNPVSTIAAARTLALALKLQTFYLFNDSAITLADAYEGYTFIGNGTGNQVTLGSQDVDNSHFENLTVTGTQGGTGMIQVKMCMLNAVTDLEGWIEHTLLTGNTTVRAGTTTTFSWCNSGVPGGSTPELTFGAGVVAVAFRDYSGGLQINSMTGDDTMSFDCSIGQFIIDATCSGGTLHARGNHTLTDNASGAVTVTDDARIDVAQINAQADLALTDYDGPTKSEMDTAHALLATAAALTSHNTTLSLVSGDVSAILVDTGTDGVVLINDAITSGKIASNAIGASEIAENAIGASELATNAIGADQIAGDAIDDGALAADTDVYEARVTLIVDAANSEDSYAVGMFKNGAPVLSGVTVPKLTVTQMNAAGTVLLNAVTLLEAGSTGLFYYDSSTLTTAGVAYQATITATIDGSSRTMTAPVGRDSDA